MYSVLITKLRSLSRYSIINKQQIRNITVIQRQIDNQKTCASCNSNLISYRYKSKNRKKGKESDSESEKEDLDWDEEIIDKNTKIMNVKVNSLRTDILLKMGLGMARNKIETLFYESKIRVNGEKIYKKSELLKEGDEIDLVKGVSMNNPKHLVVARVEVLSVREGDEKVSVKLRRNKSLIVENYQDSPWKQSE